MKKEHFDQMLAKASKSVQALNRDLARVCPKPHETTIDPQLQSAEPECPVCNEPLAEGKGAQEGTSRIRVEINSFRHRLLDPDNLCPKYIVDCLRYWKYIPDDTSKDIQLIVQQSKCSKKDERTEIELTYP